MDDAGLQTVGCNEPATIASAASTEPLTFDDLVNYFHAGAKPRSVWMVGAEFERDTLLNFTQVVDEAERYGIPTLAVTAVGKEMERDAKYLSLATRIAGELGARVVKTYFCDDFERVAGTSPVPVVIAGGG